MSGSGLSLVFAVPVIRRLPLAPRRARLLCRVTTRRTVSLWESASIIVENHSPNVMDVLYSRSSLAVMDSLTHHFAFHAYEPPPIATSSFADFDACRGCPYDATAGLRPRWALDGRGNSSRFAYRNRLLRHSCP